MQRNKEVRLVYETEVGYEKGIVYTTVSKDGAPHTTGMLLHDYIAHHRRAARIIAEAMAGRAEVVAIK
jgi:hypothetical protein